MRLIIEIDDKALKSAIEAQVGKAIADMANDVINLKVDEVLDKKADRIIERLIGDAGKSIEKAVRSTFKKNAA